MKVKSIINQNYQLLTYIETADNDFLSCYSGDLLSRVIKNAQDDQIIITIINHINTIATAVMIDAPCIIICEGQMPTDMMIIKANEAHIALIKTELKAFEVVIDLHKRGLI